MKKVITWIAVIAVVVVGIALRIATRGTETPARSIEEIQAAEGVPVDVATVREGTITEKREITGDISGFRQSTLRASAGYKIAEVSVAEGENVKRGQRLIRYDTAVSPDNMARYDQANEAYANAKRLVSRLEPLFEQGAIAESELDAARTRLAIAEADLRNSRLEIEIVSPISGVVTLIPVRAGDVVESGDVVAQVAVLDSVRVEAEVSEETVRHLRTGAPVILKDGQETGREIGRVTRVSLGADPDTRLFRVEAVLNNKTHELKPGYMVTLEVVMARVDNAIVIPHEAVLGDEVIQQGKRSEVYAVSGGNARKATIEVGRVGENTIEVKSGLNTGDIVVVFGANRLEDGKKVQMHRVDGVLQKREVTGTGEESK